MNTRKLFAAAALVLLGAFAGSWLGQIVHAQTTVALQLTGSAPHTTCAVTTLQTTFCFASDGLWQSLNGAAYTQLGVAAAAGVTSWNGLTGVVTYTPPAAPVASVNGKTGAVVLSATTTVN